MSSRGNVSSQKLLNRVPWSSKMGHNKSETAENYKKKTSVTFLNGWIVKKGTIILQDKH